MATGSHVNVHDVWQRRVQMSKTSIAAAHSQRPRRSDVLRQDRVLQAAEPPNVGGCPRSSEVDQGEVDTLAAADDDPPRARRHRRWERKTDVGRWRWWPVVWQVAAEAVHYCRPVGRAAHLDGSSHCHTKANLYYTQSRKQTLPPSDSDAVLYVSECLIVNIWVVKLVLTC